MDEETNLLRQLLDKQLDPEDQRELETRLLRQPGLRRQLADVALEGDQSFATALLRVETISKPPSAEVDVAVGPTLGQGGMAVVRLGHQLKLDRAVAVKTLRNEFQSGEGVERLLREARITGRLEHPNIVPVHDIVRGEDGLPQVVLKLIEGHTWSSLMDAPQRVEELFGVHDLLEWNLGVLMSVARALAFAHSRNILHRDVKPSNVMVGPFGEVYLLDWGIALDMQEDQGDAAQPSGTTGYMAPEQFGASEGRLGPWTDTYLLGATLFRILTGRAPHADKPVEERFVDIANGEPPPELPGEVPLELRNIVRSALQPDTHQRTQSPEALRISLMGFLRHRGALRLAVRGHEARSQANEASNTRDDRSWEPAMLAAGLAYRAALDDWPECEDALTGTRALVVLRIEYDLRRGDIPAAVRTLAAHPDVPEELRRQVLAAETLANEERDTLRQLVTDADRGLGHRMRGLLGGGFGILWVGFWCTMAIRPPRDVTPLIAVSLGLLVLGFVVVAKWAKQMLQNRINRTSLSVIGTGLVMNIVWCLGASWLGLEIPQILTGFLLVCSFIVCGMATLMDPWGGVSAAGFAIAFLVAAGRPAALPYAMVGGNLVMLLNQLALNYARGRRGFTKLPKIGR